MSTRWLLTIDAPSLQCHRCWQVSLLFDCKPAPLHPRRSVLFQLVTPHYGNRGPCWSTATVSAQSALADCADLPVLLLTKAGF